jgi:4-diphosphocytidyl-2-C-methyl-D-erythritol kinase
MVVYPNCKINIGLRILNKRSDGYHNIESVFYPVPVCDILEITRQEGNLENNITFKSTGIAIPGEANENICVKAYQLINQDYALPAIDVHLHKQIPIGAGLGGGSADAAFFIKALNEFDELNLSFGEMHHYAKQIGSDCSFFINNKPALALQKGEVLEPINVSLKAFHIVIVYPNIHISTALAYSGVVPNATGESIEDLMQQPIHTWKATICNAFEAGIIKQFPVIGDIKNELYALGAQYASMTGSGSAVYGIFENKPELTNNFSNFTVFETILN